MLPWVGCQLSFAVISCWERTVWQLAILGLCPPQTHKCPPGCCRMALTAAQTITDGLMKDIITPGEQKRFPFLLLRGAFFAVHNKTRKQFVVGPAPKKQQHPRTQGFFCMTLQTLLCGNKKDTSSGAKTGLSLAVEEVQTPIAQREDLLVPPPKWAGF